MQIRGKDTRGSSKELVQAVLVLHLAPPLISLVLVPSHLSAKAPD